MTKFFGFARVGFFVPVLFIFAFASSVFTQDKTPQTTATPAPTAKGRPPVIIIPGLIGSELIDKTSGKLVWFNLKRSKTDDLRLPITSANLARNRDNLLPHDIIRDFKIVSFLPETEIYGKLIDALQADGYTEGNWTNPSVTGFQDSFYVFPYDWRRDNVENARILMQKIQTLKTRLRRPKLKFNIVAHSMGGLIARYAAMYGGADLPAGTAKPRPTWAGASQIGKIFLVGTPNEGSVPSLNSLINGFSLVGGKINLPFVQDLTQYDIFTIPAMYQLLPHAGTLHAYDENLKPLDIDLYDPATWEKYGWAAYTEDNFTKKFSPAEQRNAKAYFAAVLARAKRFEDALDTPFASKTAVPIYFLGSECKPTPDGVVIVRDRKKDRWRTIFKPETFERADGTKVSDKELEPLLTSPGDGVVTKRSFISTRLEQNVSNPLTTFPVCENHSKLTGNPEIQKSLFSVLDAR